MDATTQSKSGWTIDTLKEYLVSLIDANDKKYNEHFEHAQTAVNAALAAAEKAVTKAEVASEKRFEGVNEFRSTLADQQRTLMPRPEVEIMMKSMDQKIENFSARLSAMEGNRRGLSQGWGWAVGAVGLVAALIAIASRFIN